MKKFTCPYCYGIHDIRSCGLKCSYNIPNKSDKCVTNVVKDNEGWIPEIDKMRCMKCQFARKSFYCKVIDKEIPNDFLDGENLSIALLGARASGKSNYIGVLVNEIRKKMTLAFNCTLSLSASEESKEFYDEHYYNPLYRSGEVVEATSQDDVPPLIFPLRFLDKNNRIKQVAALSFYDTAGENLDSTDNMLISNRYIPNADGIILLLDPLQVPSIRSKLQGKINLPSENTDVTTILSRIIQNIRDVKNVKGIIKTPIALAFTKIDALEEFDILREDSCLRSESEHLKRGVFVQTDFESVNIEMQDLLENWLDGEILQQLKNFKNYALFGLTSLGGVPNGSKLSKSINPRRVLDPLLWVLAENNYIQKAKK